MGVGDLSGKLEHSRPSIEKNFAMGFDRQPGDVGISIEDSFDDDITACFIFIIDFW